MTLRVGSGIRCPTFKADRLDRAAQDHLTKQGKSHAKEIFRPQEGVWLEYTLA